MNRKRKSHADKTNVIPFYDRENEKSRNCEIAIAGKRTISAMDATVIECRGREATEGRVRFTQNNVIRVLSEGKRHPSASQPNSRQYGLITVDILLLITLLERHHLLQYWQILLLSICKLPIGTAIREAGRVLELRWPGIILDP